MTTHSHHGAPATLTGHQTEQPDWVLSPDVDPQRFRTTVECAPVGIAHISFDGRWLWVNDRLCSIVGYSREELLGNSFQEVNFAEDLAPHLGHVEEMLRGETGSYEMDNRYVGKDGKIVWVHLTVSFMRDAAGKPQHFISVIEDIRERKRLERTLAQRASLLDQAYDAIFARTFDGVILYWNKGAESLYGYAASETIGRISHALFRTMGTRDSAAATPGTTTSAAQVIEAQAEALTREGHWEGELAHLVQDGRQIVVESRQNLVHDGNGHIIVLEANRDITERKRLEEEQAHIRNIVGHEMGTPLTTLKARMQLLRREIERQEANGKSARSPRTIEHLGAMERAMAQIERQLIDLRTVVRVAQGDLTIERESCDLVDLCRQVVEEQRLISQRRIDVTLPATPMLLEADSGRLRQVLTNLLTNALKYSPKDRPVFVALDQDTNEDMVTIAVKDEGSGIAAEALPHLFEQFYRVPGVQAQGGGGSAANMGLGLYIAQAIVEQHGGSISVESRPGHGSTFTVSLPLSAVPPIASAESAVKCKGGRAS
ncbi:MAG: PAS domain S-box protein [Ktedonobacterales bacterium]